MMLVPHRKHTYELPRPLTGTMKKKREKWVVVRDTTGGGNRIYHRFEGSQALPVCPSGNCKTGIGLLFSMYMMFVHHRKHLWASAASFGDRFTFLH
jgi:hypothetical protein